jgi:hypothetical protein
MKKYLFLPLIVIGLWSCNQAPETEEAVVEELMAELAVFGDESITADGAVAVNELPAMIEGKDSLEVKLSGTINECCQTKGCWMTMDMGNGEEMMVRFKDYGFFVPKDAGGKECIIEGVAKVEEISVEELRHYAEDAGKTEEEIAAITEPERKMSFTASGVIIQ